VYAIHCVLFWWIFGPDNLPIGGDGYFHYTMASKLAIGNPAQSIEALPFTVLGEQGPDHHWLIHWLQKPLTLFFTNSEHGIAPATIAWAALVPAFLSAILRYYHVPYAPVVATIGVWGLYILPSRLLMFRAHNAAIVMVVFMALLMSAQRYFWVGVFIFFFNHAYQGVVLAGAVGLAALLSHALIYKRFDRFLISASLAGFILSLLTSPWFPDNIRYFLIIMMGRLVSPLNNLALMGREWLPPEPSMLFKLGLVGHVCLILSWLILGTQWKFSAGTAKLKRALTFTILASIFLMLYARHWRMGEFYGPISAMAFGFCLALLVNRGRLLVGLIILSTTVLTISHQYLISPPYRATAIKVESFCEYLEDNAEPDDLVFNLSWSSFPYLYHCQPQLAYISGLDGMMLAQGDGEIFRIWYYLSRGYLGYLDSKDVAAVFSKTNSAYVLLEPHSANVKVWLLGEIKGSKLVVSNSSGHLISLPQGNYD